MWNSCTIKRFFAPVKFDKKKMENEIKWPTVSRNKIYIKDNFYLKKALNSQPLDYEASMLPIEPNTQLKSCNKMLKKKLHLNTGNTTVHSGTNFLGLYRPKFHSYLYLYVSPALGCCRLIWLHMVSCIMARDPHVSSPASVLKLGCNIHLLMKPGQRKNECFYIFCQIRFSTKITALEFK